MPDFGLKTDVSLVETALLKLGDKALNLGGRILFAILFFVIGAQVIRFVRRIVRRGMERAKADVGVVQFVDSFLKAALYVVLAFMIAASFGVDAASIVALLGSAGVAIGLAVQGSLSNLAGGVLILLLKPFKVGDYIVEGSSGREGEVAEIQIFYTKLVTPDNREVILPNGALANNSIVNVTTRNCRRADVKVGISYRADLRKAKEVLLKMLREDGKVLQDREVNVFVEELGESAVILNLRCWFANEDFWAGTWRIAENCKYTLDDAGIEIPFRQLDVHMQG
ncbi:MAG: mechanosensitive ion channel family protein [Muribaculum sp.]|nr:mechanosensitive ion channel family protein [Muribaculum sp.]